MVIENFDFYKDRFKELELTLKIKLADYPSSFCLTNTYGGDFYISSTPFSNCQIFTIGQFEAVINNSKIQDILTLIQKFIQKNQLMVDVVRGYEEKVEKIIPLEFINFKQQYENTSGSSMTMYLIKLKEYEDFKLSGSK